MNGGAEAVSPVVKRLREGGAQVRVLSYRAATDSFRAMGIEPDRILENASSRNCRAEIGQFGPDTLLTGTQLQDEEHERTLEQALWATSGIARIKSVALVDSWDCLAERFRDLDPDEAGKMVIVRGGPARIPSVIALPGEMAREELIAAGLPTERLVVTGNPYFEHVLNEAANLPPETRKTLLEKPVFSTFKYGGKLIVFMSDQMDAYPDLGFTEKGVLGQFLQAIDELAESEGMKINVIVRPHPFRKEGAQEAFAVDTRNIAKVLHNPISARGNDPENEYTMEELLKAADIVAGTFNNPLITAAIMGVPVIQFLPGMDRKYRFQEFLAKEGCAARLDDSVQVKDLVKALFSKRFSLRPLGAAEGATDRVIEQL